MGFLNKLFGGKDKKPDQYVDTQGVYFYVQCDNCGQGVRVRADKQYDLENDGNGYAWHKTIVDNHCFRPMPAVVHLNGRYEVTDQDITGGRFISQEDYNALMATPQPVEDTDDRPSEDK